MKKRYFNNGKAISFLLLSFLVLTNNVGAQQVSTLYWMQGVPQSIYFNPGLTPDANIYMGMPGLSAVHVRYANSAFRIDDLIKRNDDGLFYIDDNNMLSKLGENNYLGVGAQAELLAFGFRVEENYFSLNLTDKADVLFTYPDDFMYLSLKGNDHFREKDQAADFAGLGVNASHYRELGLGFSRQWLDELSAGVRAKLLFGIANINVEKYDYVFYTDPETYGLDFHSYMLLNTSQSFIDIEVDDDITEIDMTTRDFELQNYMLNFNNLGFAIDLGGVYEIDERFEVGLSVLDLGFISWKSDVENLVLERAFNFEGFDLNDIINFIDDADDDNDFDFGQILSDTLNEWINLEQTYNSYRTMLPTKILLSGTFNITDIHKTGLLFRGDIFEGNFYPSVTAAYHIQPIPPVGASLSYSYMHNNFSNIGLGFHLNFYPFQFYLVMDNFIPSLYPHTIQTTTLQLGINWVLDYMPYVARPMFSW